MAEAEPEVKSTADLCDDHGDAVQVLTGGFGSYGGVDAFRGPGLEQGLEILQEVHQQKIISSVCTMAQGMAYFQKKFDVEKITLLEDVKELEEYCYFVAGAVGEMLCDLFISEIPNLPESNEKKMRKKQGWGRRR